MTIINLENVSYRQKELTILENINWTVKSGENWVVFGPNGSGKTTLMKILTGYIRPTEGIADVLHRTIGRTNVSELRKKIAWVSNDLFRLINPQDIATEIVIAGLNAGTRMWQAPSKHEVEKALQIMEIMGIKDKARSSFYHLSQGEQKKVLISRALILDPELVILDEPCEGLDISAREQFLEGLKKVSQLPSHPDIMFVTHHIEEITPLFDHILFLKGGKVFSSGPIDENLNTNTISPLFDMKIEIEKSNSRYKSHYY